METNEEFKDFLDKSIKKSSLMIRILGIVAPIAVIVGVFASVSRQKELVNEKKDLAIEKQVLEEEKNKIEAQNTSLISNALEQSLIRCVGIPTGKKSSQGLPLYNFSFSISNDSIVSLLDSVQYYFEHPSYTPQLKTAVYHQENFAIYVPDSWGCMTTVPVYFFYKGGNRDTLQFRMCDQAHLQLPEIKGK